MTAQLAPTPIFKGWDNNGSPLAFGFLTTYAAGTLNKIASYVDSTQTTQNQNPQQLNFRGEMPLWLDPTRAYKLALTDSQGNVIPGWPVDNVNIPATAWANVLFFGASTSIPDNSAAFTLALNSGASVVYVPAGTYNFTSGIIVPGGVELRGDGCFPTNPQTGGTNLLFALAVPTCVTLGGVSGNNRSVYIRDVGINRVSGGTPPAGCIGLLNQNTYGGVIEDVLVVNHQIPVEFLGDRGSLGITCMVNRLFTGAAYDSHIVIDTFPEVRFNQCRFGRNGAGDQNCNSYVRIQGGSTINPANGPNTVIFENCQFNQGQGTGARWIAFQNQQVGSISDIELFQVNNCYIEDDVVGIFTDATWTQLINLFISNTQFNPAGPTQQFLALNAATQIANWQISNCNIKCAFTVAPTPQINGLYVGDTEFLGLVSVTSPTTGSVVSMSNIGLQAGLTIAGPQTGCRYSGIITSGSLTKSGLTAGTYPIIDLSGYNNLTPWFPTLAIGGSTTGITYTVEQAYYQISNSVVFCSFSITVLSTGGLAGAVTINDLPVPDSTFSAGGAGGGACYFVSGAAGLTGQISLEVNGGIVNLYQNGATGISTVSNANVVASTVLRGSFNYVRA